MADSIDKEKLTRELAIGRDKMAGYVGALRRDLDLGARLKTGAARNPLAWFTGAIVIGLALSRIPPTRRKASVKLPFLRTTHAENAGKAGALLAVLKFGLDFAKPALVAWAKRRYFSNQSRATPPRP